MSTLDDELALQKLMARYVDAVHRRDADSWAACWCDDASWTLVGSEVNGRDNILALWLQVMQGFEFAMIMPASSLFDIDGDSASGHWYLQEYTRTIEGEPGFVLSRYRDHYRRLDGQWRYQSRHYDILYQGPADLSGTFTAPP